MSAKIPLHKRINWPEWVDMESLAIGIMTLSHARIGIVLPITAIIKHYNSKAVEIVSAGLHWRGHILEQERAAMWYAVMRTAIETYGMKA